VARYRLRYQNHEIEVPPGEFAVGRSAECQLTLDDPLVSRRHALFHASPRKLSVEDLGSRNGVKLNGTRIAGEVELSPGDVVTVGSEEFTVEVISGESQTKLPRKAAVTMTGPAPDANVLVGGGGALALLSGVVDKALAMGRVDEAERILSNLLAETLTGLQTGKRDASTLPDAAKYALTLAAQTGKASWIDWVFSAYHAAHKMLPASTVDELYNLVRKTKFAMTPALRAYLDGIRNTADQLSPTERFVLQRLEGLVRVVLAS